MSIWKIQLINEFATLRSTFIQKASIDAKELEALKLRLNSVDCCPGEHSWKAFQSTVESLVLAIAQEKDQQSALHEATVACSALVANAATHISERSTFGEAVGDFVLASYGLFLASVLEGDDRGAALIVYSTTQKHPAPASQIFPENTYGAEYREILHRSYRDVQRAVKSHAQLAQRNTAKKFKSYPTRVLRIFLIIPISYFAAILGGIAVPAKGQNTSSRRTSGYVQRVKKLYDSRIASFDKKTHNSGWNITRSENLKEEMILDQVKRAKSIFRNHCLTAAREAKARERELEATSNLK